MKWLNFLSATILTFCGSWSVAEEPSAACSIHLFWSAPEATWFTNEATVLQTTPGSYFMICGWNTGYFGVQELGNGKRVVIFSVWDPTPGDIAQNVRVEDRVEVLFQGKKTEIARFGGEGTGGRCLRDFPWKIGQKIRCRVRAEVAGDKTSYSGWIYQPVSQQWEHLVTFRVRTGGQLLSGFYSFLEDFRRDKRSVHEVRRVAFGNGWVKTADGEVIPITQGTFTCSSSENEARDRINAGIMGGQWFLQNGGSTRRNIPVGTRLSLPKPPAAPAR